MNPKKIYAAAASVRGARSLGIETEASRQAPALLEKAEAELARLQRKAAELEPSAPDLAHELTWAKAADKADALAAAVAELREALGLPPLPAPAEKAAGIPVAEYAERVAAEKAAKEAAEAERQRESLACDVRRAYEKADGAHRFYDAQGRKVAIVERGVYIHGRLPSEGAWFPKERFFATEDGQEVASGEIIALARDGTEFVVAGAELVCRQLDAMANQWVPPGAAEPPMNLFGGGPSWVRQREVEAAWAEAEMAKAREEKAAKKAAKKASTACVGDSAPATAMAAAFARCQISTS